MTKSKTLAKIVSCFGASTLGAIAMDNLINSNTPGRDPCTPEGITCLGVYGIATLVLGVYGWSRDSNYGRSEDPINPPTFD